MFCPFFHNQHFTYPDFWLLCCTIKGYSPGDITILTPYVGQLSRLRVAVSKSNIRIVLSEKDAQELEDFETRQETAGGEQATAASTSTSSGSGASLGKTLASQSSNSKQQAPASSVMNPYERRTVSTLRESLRLATIDNFQVWIHGWLVPTYFKVTGQKAAAKCDVFTHCCFE